MREKLAADKAWPIDSTAESLNLLERIHANIASAALFQEELFDREGCHIVEANNLRTTHNPQKLYTILKSYFPKSSFPLIERHQFGWLQRVHPVILHPYPVEERDDGFWTRAVREVVQTAEILSVNRDEEKIKAFQSSVAQEKIFPALQALQVSLLSLR